MKNKILICDKNNAIIEVTSTILQTAKYEVYTLTDISRIKETIREYNPDLILLDFVFPGDNYEKLGRYLKSENDTKKIKVILFTTSLSGQQIAQEIGADDYLPKPFELNDLLEKVNTHLGNQL